jgi:hypothetical protein
VSVTLPSSFVRCCYGWADNTIYLLLICFVTKMCDDKDTRLLRKRLKIHFSPLKSPW